MPDQVRHDGYKLNGFLIMTQSQRTWLWLHPRGVWCIFRPKSAVSITVMVSMSITMVSIVMVFVAIFSIALVYIAGSIPAATGVRSRSRTAWQENKKNHDIDQYSPFHIYPPLPFLICKHFIRLFRSKCTQVPWTPSVSFSCLLVVREMKSLRIIQIFMHQPLPYHICQGPVCGCHNAGISAG